MKLYTREQMIKAFNYGQKPKGFDWIGDMIDSLKPIELPSAEEIDIQSYLHNSFKKEDGHLLGASFRYGAKWVIEQIKQQAYV